MKTCSACHSTVRDNFIGPAASKLKDIKSSIKMPECIRTIFEKNKACLHKVFKGPCSAISTTFASVKNVVCACAKKVHGFVKAFFGFVSSTVSSCFKKVGSLFSSSSKKNEAESETKVSEGANGGDTQVGEAHEEAHGASDAEEK